MSWWLTHFTAGPRLNRKLRQLGGKPIVPPNDAGDRTTPSVIFFESKEERVVGKEAKNNAVLYPDDVVQMVKRPFGRADVSLEPARD